MVDRLEGVPGRLRRAKQVSSCPLGHQTVLTACSSRLFNETTDHGKTTKSLRDIRWPNTDVV